MRLGFWLAVAAAFTMSERGSAQALRLQNSGDRPIVMKYLPCELRPNTMAKVVIRPGETKDVLIRGNDPFDVTFHFLGEDQQQEIHAKIGAPVPLRQIAIDAQGQVFDVNLVQAAEKMPGGGMATQTTQAKLISPTGEAINLFRSPDNASEFVKDVVYSVWTTEYVALSGERMPAKVDFGRLQFETPQFAGRFNDLLVVEDERICHITGRWSAGEVRGDVFFKIERANPRRLVGEYVVDGGRDRLSWSGAK